MTNLRTSLFMEVASPEPVLVPKSKLHVEFRAALSKDAQVIDSVEKKNVLAILPKKPIIIANSLVTDFHLWTKTQGPAAFVQNGASGCGHPKLERPNSICGRKPRVPQPLCRIEHRIADIQNWNGKRQLHRMCRSSRLLCPLLRIAGVFGL